MSIMVVRRKKASRRKSPKVFVNALYGANAAAALALP